MSHLYTVNTFLYLDSKKLYLKFNHKHKYQKFLLLNLQLGNDIDYKDLQGLSEKIFKVNVVLYMISRIIGVIEIKGDSSPKKISTRANKRITSTI